GELAGAGVGFTVTGDIAALSWRAAFISLALPAFLLAWLIFRLPEPARGGMAPLVDTSASQPAETGVREPEHETDAQRLARERGAARDPEPLRRRNPGRLASIPPTRYILRIKPNVTLIVASAGGFFSPPGVKPLGVEFAPRQYSIDQAL